MIFMLLKKKQIRMVVFFMNKKIIKKKRKFRIRKCVKPVAYKVPFGFVYFSCGRCAACLSNAPFVDVVYGKKTN